MFSFTYIHMSVHFFVIISHLALKKKLAFQEKKKKKKGKKKKRTDLFIESIYISFTLYHAKIRWYVRRYWSSSFDDCYVSFAIFFFSIFFIFFFLNDFTFLKDRVENKWKLNVNCRFMQIIIYTYFPYNVKQFFFFKIFSRYDRVISNVCFSCSITISKKI